MPIGSCHQIGRPGRPGRSSSGRSWRFMQTGWLSDIYLLPFSHSILATLNQMDKLMENQASEENMLLISSKIRENSFSLSFKIIVAILCAQIQNWQLLETDWNVWTRTFLVTSLRVSNISSVYQDTHRRKVQAVQAMVWMLCLPEANRPLCSWASAVLSELLLRW